MRPYSTLTDEQLVEEYQAAKSYADELYARLDDFKAEFLARFKETGQLDFESETHKLSMRKQAPSVAWLKREYGMAEDEIPAACRTEKLTIVPDWAKVRTYLEEVVGVDWRETYAPSLKAKPMKV